MHTPLLPWHWLRISMPLATLLLLDGVIAMVGKNIFSFTTLSGDSAAFIILHSGDKRGETYLKLSM